MRSTPTAITIGQAPPVRTRDVLALPLAVAALLVPVAFALVVSFQGRLPLFAPESCARLIKGCQQQCGSDVRGRPSGWASARSAADRCRARCAERHVH